MNENGFTGSDSCDVLKGMPRSHEDDWQRGRLIEGKIRRNAAHVPGSRERVGGETKCAIPKTLAWLDMRHWFPNGGDDARHFIAKMRASGALLREGKRLENITEIHSAALLQSTPAGLAGWHLEGNKMESVEMPSFARVQP